MKCFTNLLENDFIKGCDCTFLVNAFEQSAISITVLYVICKAFVQNVLTFLNVELMFECLVIL